MIEIPGVSSFLKSLPLFCYTFFGGDYVFCIFLFKRKVGVNSRRNIIWDGVGDL